MLRQEISGYSYENHDRKFEHDLGFRWQPSFRLDHGEDHAAGHIARVVRYDDDVIGSRDRLVLPLPRLQHPIPSPEVHQDVESQPQQRHPDGRHLGLQRHHIRRHRQQSGVARGQPRHV